MHTRARGATLTSQKRRRSHREELTMSTLTDHQPSMQSVETIFSRVLVGIDGSPESSEAARQAALLEMPGGTLTLLAAWNLAPPLVTPMTTLPAYAVTIKS